MIKSKKLIGSFLVGSLLLAGCGTGEDIEIEKPFKSEKKSDSQKSEKKKSNLPAMQKVTPLLLGMADTGGPTDLVKAPNSDTIYTADGRYIGFHAVDISNPSAPNLYVRELKDVDNMWTPAYSVSITSDGKKAILISDGLSGWNVIIYNINGNDLTLVKKIEIDGLLLPQNVSVLSSDDKILYVATKGYEDAIKVIDIEQEKVISAINVAADKLILSKDEKKLYALSSDGFKIIDIRNDNYNTISTYKQNVSGHYSYMYISPDEKYIYLSTTEGINFDGLSNTMDIIDISNSKAPVKVSSIAAEDPKAFLATKDGTIGYLIADEKVFVYDIRDVLVPVLIGTLEVPDMGDVTDVILSDDEKFLYIGDYHDGLYVVKTNAD